MQQRTSHQPSGKYLDTFYKKYRKIRNTVFLTKLLLKSVNLLDQRSLLLKRTLAKHIKTNPFQSLTIAGLIGIIFSTYFRKR